MSLGPGGTPPRAPRLGAGEPRRHRARIPKGRALRRALHLHRAHHDQRQDGAVGGPFSFRVPDPRAARLRRVGPPGLPHEVGGGLCLFDDPRNQWNPQPERRGAPRLRRARALFDKKILVTGDLDSAAEEQIPSRQHLRYRRFAVRSSSSPIPFWAIRPRGSIRGPSCSKAKADGASCATPVDSTSPPTWPAGSTTRSTGSGAGWRHRASPLDYPRRKACWIWLEPRCPELLDPVTFGKVGGLVLVGCDQLPRSRRPRRRKARRWGFVELTGADTVPPAALRGWGVQPLTLAERALRDARAGRPRGARSSSAPARWARRWRSSWRRPAAARSSDRRLQLRGGERGPPRAASARGWRAEDRGARPRS